MISEAFSIGGRVFYWDAIVTALAAAVCFVMTLSFYKANGGRSRTVWILLPLAVFFSVVLSRTIYWYAHTEQFSGLFSALTDYGTGSYSLPGVLGGTALAVLLLRLVGLEKKPRLLFDCLAPGGALGLSLIRLSQLFNTSCRGKIVITDPALQRLPLASLVTTTAGTPEYRFATFFVEALVFLAFFIVLLICFAGKRRTAGDGSISRLFLLLYCAAEIVLDSTRYDSSFFSFNAFISVVQILCTVAILAVLICCSVRSVRLRGLKPWHFGLWLCYLATLGGAGYLEYLVQRHGDWYIRCYSLMTLSCAAMVAVVLLMARSGSARD